MRNRDGIRSKVGQGCVTPLGFFAIGRGLALYIRKKRLAERVVVAKDTRPSSNLLANMFVSGVLSEGVEALHVGVLPTPGIGGCVAAREASFGAVVTGSHNKYDVNGLKLFDGNRCKVSSEIWDCVMEYSEHEWAPPQIFLEPQNISGATIYGQSLLQEWDAALPCPQVIVDCGYGACSVMQSIMGESFIWLNTHSGIINNGVGSLYPDYLKEQVAAHGADAGFALDGDGDRLVACTSEGRVLDGQDLLAILAHYEKAQCVVVSLVTNRGLVEALEQKGIRVVISEVGDASVARAMREHGATLGAEPSGHVLLLDTHVGDGLRVMARLVRIMQTTGKSLAELRIPWLAQPFRVCSVACHNKVSLEALGVNQVVDELRAKFEDYKIIVQKSQTEPLVRIFVEGKSQAIVSKIAGDLFITIQDRVRVNKT